MSIPPNKLWDVRVVDMWLWVKTGGCWLSTENEQNEEVHRSIYQGQLAQPDILMCFAGS